MSKKINIVIGITGASGSIYAKVLLEKLAALKGQIGSAGIILSDNARQVWEQELASTGAAEGRKGRKGDISGGALLPLTLPAQFKYYGKSDFMAPFASGSSDYRVMIICPCSMGTMARIATGVSNDLITRAADVMLKERRKLILVPRDTPLSLIHINNMKAVTEAGGIICPASPSFYSRPATFEALASTVVDRVLDLSGLDVKMYRWGK